MGSKPTSIRLGTRGSLLARTQSLSIAEALESAHPGLLVEMVVITTSGDQLIDRSLAELGGKGLFTKELELAMLAGQIDLAVHSLKDVPVTMPLVDQSELIIAAIPAREDARDVLVSRLARSVAELPPGTKVGTGSLRRRCQLLQARPDLLIAPLRGNVDTRLRKLEEGEWGAIVLAAAGLKRLSRWDDSCMTPIDPAVILPAAGQGALALQCRRDDERTIALVAVLNDVDAAQATTAERAVVAQLQGDCHSPIAAYATIEQDNLTLQAAVGGRDPNAPGPVVRASATVPRARWKQAVDEVCGRLPAV
jgi:hydroxymethylbilane synthase